MKKADQRVNVAELRQNLPKYLAAAKNGREIEVTSRGRVIARILPTGDPQQEARERLLTARRQCRVGDVIEPIALQWEADG